MARTRVVSEEYHALMAQVQRMAHKACATIVPYHTCADCGSIVDIPRVYCKRCEIKACTTSGCGGNRNPRGMLIHYGLEEWE